MIERDMFIREYNKANNINDKDNLDIYDECEFSYLDILKEKEVEVVSKVYTDCKCVSSANFSVYYNKCDKCDGKGSVSLNYNQVTCNHCFGNGRIVKDVCPLCQGEGKLIKRGLVKVKLNKNLKDNDFLLVKGKGKSSREINGDLHIKVKISDKNCFQIIGNDIYDRRIIEFNKEEINKGISKNVETIKGFVKVKSTAVNVHEVVKLNNEGIDGGDFYVCLHNELTEIRGEDVYKNIIINKKELGFYLSRDEIEGSAKFLNVTYYKKINDYNYEYVELSDVNNFKIVKLKYKGLKGKNNGVNGDLYLRIYFDDEFYLVNDKLYYRPINLNKYEVNDGKKILEFNKDKITLTFNKNLNESKELQVKDYGAMIDKNLFENLNFIINPFEHNLYEVSVNVSKKDKVIYIKDYKKYFNELVKINNSEGIKVILSKKINNYIVYDSDGNQISVNVIR